MEIGDIHESIYNLLEIVNGYFNGDRSYTFDIDYDKNVINNTDEYFVEGITSQIDNLQNIPISVISEWMVNFKQNKPYYVSNLNQEKGTESYDVLDAQDIDRLLAVPLIKDDVVIGFLGVDNPRKHCDDATLLSSIRYFITETVYMKKQQENLEYLSYRDVLTGMYNRNKYMDVVDMLNEADRLMYEEKKHYYQSNKA